MIRGRRYQMAPVGRRWQRIWDSRRWRQSLLWYQFPGWKVALLSWLRLAMTLTRMRFYNHRKKNDPTLLSLVGSRSSKNRAIWEAVPCTLSTDRSAGRIRLLGPGTILSPEHHVWLACMGFYSDKPSVHFYAFSLKATGSLTWRHSVGVGAVVESSHLLRSIVALSEDHHDLWYPVLFSFSLLFFISFLGQGLAYLHFLHVYMHRLEPTSATNSVNNCSDSS